MELGAGAVGLVLVIAWIWYASHQAQQEREKRQREDEHARAVSMASDAAQKVAGQLSDLEERAEELLFCDLPESWLLALGEAAGDAADEVEALRESFDRARSDELGPRGEWLGGAELMKWHHHNGSALAALDRRVGTSKQWAKRRAKLARMTSDIGEARKEAEAISSRLTSDAGEAALSDARLATIELRRRTQALKSKFDSLERKIEDV